VVDAVLGLLPRASGDERHVLALDDDPAVLAALRALLEPRGIRLTSLGDPRGFWDALESERPDLLMMDFEMPHASGADLCRVVRSDPRWSVLPILMLTARTDAETIQRLFAAGADDYVAKPFVGPELVTRIENRLERARFQRLYAETDPLTGVANRARSEESIAQLLRVAARHRAPVSIAVVGVDGLRAFNERQGHAAGDEALRRVARVLRGALRGEDVLARWGGQEFVLAMYGVEREDGVTRLADALARLDEGDEALRVTFSAGVAEAPADGAELPELYRAAAGALHQARDAGGGRVIPAGWSAESPERAGSVDVLVVDDDEALAALLVHALETRGYSVRWLSDGREAVEALGGPRPALRARLVLLDVDLPGYDGLSVLRALARDRVLDRTRVVMLTVRAGQREVLDALEMGAVDHVAKPFSIPVLLQRVRRALRED
jgi:diguanylate cyclase (GGDEF)-like protein